MKPSRVPRAPPGRTTQVELILFGANPLKPNPDRILVGIDGRLTDRPIR
jgi:hypothetical protein